MITNNSRGSKKPASGIPGWTKSELKEFRDHLNRLPDLIAQGGCGDPAAAQFSCAADAVKLLDDFKKKNAHLKTPLMTKRFIG